MAVDPRFFDTTGPFALDTILRVTGAESGHSSKDRLFVGVAALDVAEADEVSFCETARYIEALKQTRAGAVLVPANLVEHVPLSAMPLVSNSAAGAFALLARMFHPSGPETSGIHSTAIIEPGADVGGDCAVGPYSVVSAGARIGSGCRVGSHCHIGPSVVLGPECVLHDHVSISHAVCGDRVIIFPGARIGQEGFGFTATPRGDYVTAPQVGIVEIGSDVQIGANSCIDRGSLGNTILGAGTRLDNLVQVGHNVKLGKGCVLVAQVGISGSTVFEDRVMVGGQAGFAGHLTVGRGAKIAAQAGVMTDVGAGVEMFGSPARPIREAVRSLHVLKKLTDESRYIKKRLVE